MKSKSIWSLLVLIILSSTTALAQSGEYKMVPGKTCKVASPAGAQLGPSWNSMSVQIVEISKSKYRAVVSLSNTTAEIAAANFYLCDERGVAGAVNQLTCPSIQIDTVAGNTRITLPGNGMSPLINGTFKLATCQDGAYVPIELLK